jgi:hypothetical protein
MKKFLFQTARPTVLSAALPLALLAAGLFLVSGCVGSGGEIQRNKAGTRSVTISGNGGGQANPEPFEVSNVAGLSEAPLDIASLPEIPDAEPGPEDFETGDTRLPVTGDVIEIKEKLFIAQTNDVYLNPDDYLGKTIKLEGLFKSVYSEETDSHYRFVIRYGPGCCGNDGSAGFEVAWGIPNSPNPRLLESYPLEDAWVEAVGVLKNYEEDGYPFLYMSLLSLTAKEERGAEFVSQ